MIRLAKIAKYGKSMFFQATWTAWKMSLRELNVNMNRYRRERKKKKKKEKQSARMHRLDYQTRAITRFVYAKAED